MSLWNIFSRQRAKSAPDSGWERPYEKLRAKWGEVPSGLSVRRGTADMLGMADAELLQTWESIRKETTAERGFSTRGWYHTLYRDVLRGKKVMDVGCGAGIDAVSFAEVAKEMTVVDIVQSNVDLVLRIARLKGFDNITGCYMRDTSSLDSLDSDYDVIWCQGSMLHTPFDIIRHETAAMLEHLPIGGRWIELAYPKERWVRDKRKPFDEWGEMTDGAGTPWVEWYDLDKTLARLAPATFDVVLDFNFHNDDFVWFDLLRTG